MADDQNRCNCEECEAIRLEIARAFVPDFRMRNLSWLKESHAEPCGENCPRCAAVLEYTATALSTGQVSPIPVSAQKRVQLANCPTCASSRINRDLLAMTTDI